MAKKLTPKPNTKPKQARRAAMTSLSVTEIIQIHIANATLCFTQGGKCREIQKLLHYLMSQPDYLRKHPSFTDIVSEKCREWSRDPESASIIGTIQEMQETIKQIKESTGTR